MPFDPVRGRDETLSYVVFQPLAAANGSIDSEPEIDAALATWADVTCSKLDIVKLPDSGEFPSAVLDHEPQREAARLAASGDERVHPECSPAAAGDRQRRVLRAVRQLAQLISGEANWGPAELAGPHCEQAKHFGHDPASVPAGA